MSCAVLLYSKLVLLADTSFVLLKVCIDTQCVMGFVPHAEKYCYLRKSSDLWLQKCYKKISMLKKQHCYCSWQCWQYIYYCTYQFICSDTDGKDTKVQYQLMIWVLQLLFVHTFTGCDTTSRIFYVELVKSQYSKFLSKMIKYYHHFQS